MVDFPNSIKDQASSFSSCFSNLQNDKYLQSFQRKLSLLSNTDVSATKNNLLESLCKAYQKQKADEPASIAEVNCAIKKYFELQITSKDLNPLCFEDFEKYIDENVSKTELLPILFLYTQAHFDTRNLNKIFQPPQLTFERKQGECDDISIFIAYFAQKKGLRGDIVSEQYKQVDNNEFGHVAYFQPNSSGITMVDHQQYGHSSLPSYQELLFRRAPWVATAKVIPLRIHKAKGALLKNFFSADYKEHIWQMLKGHDYIDNIGFLQEKALSCNESDIEELFGKSLPTSMIKSIYQYLRSCNKGYVSEVGFLRDLDIESYDYVSSNY